MKTLTRNLKKIVLVVAALLLAPLLFAVSMYGFAYVQGSLKMNRLTENAQLLERELRDLVFVEGESIGARGIVEGGELTAQSDPAASTYARGALSVNRRFASLESEIHSNLLKSGFVKEGTAESAYYRTSPNAKSFDSIVLRYTHADRAVRVTYQFSTTYACTTGYVCEYTSRNRTPGPYLPLSGFGDYTVSGVRVSYAAKSNEFHSGFRF